MASPPNVYDVLLVEVKHLLYGSPAKGFATRLKVQIAFVGYLTFLTLLYLILYIIKLRRRNEKFWIWRLIQKPEGRYLNFNFFTLTILFLVNNILFICYVNNTYQVFINNKSQMNAGYWRNLIWIGPTLQGWAYSFSTVQTLLVTRTGPTSRKAPYIANFLYIFAPFVMVLVALILGVLSGKTWNKAIRYYEQTRDLLMAASASFNATGMQDPTVLTQLFEIRTKAMAVTATFESQHRNLCIVWSVEILAVLIVNIIGFSLVIRLNKQLRQTKNLMEGGTDITLTRDVPVRLGAPSPAFSFPATKKDAQSPIMHGTLGARSPGFDNFKLGAPSMPMTTEEAMTRSNHSGGDAHSSPLSQLRAHGGSIVLPEIEIIHTGPSYSHQAMKKLIRDLTCSIRALFLLAILFMGHVIFAATHEDRFIVDWRATEVGLTLTTWGYGVLGSAAMTYIVLNLVMFEFVSSARANNYFEKSSQSGRSGSGARLSRTPRRSPAAELSMDNFTITRTSQVKEEGDHGFEEKGFVENGVQGSDENRQEIYPKRVTIPV